MEIRNIETFEEYELCVELQRRVWGYTDRDLIPARYLKVSHMHGGSVLGAFSGPGELVGFAYAQPSIHQGRLALHSNLLAVLPEFQDQGLGARLKLAQRRDALARGIGLMTWTFDPMQARNAYLNLNKLGAIARAYLQDVYGVLTSSSLHGKLGTDRVLAEWHLDSPRVREALAEPPAVAGNKGQHNVALPPCLLRADAARDGSVSLVTGAMDLADRQLSLEIPASLSDLMQANLDLAKEWRRLSREYLIHYFRCGYQLSRLVRVAGKGPGPVQPFRTYYLLETCENRSH